MRPMPKARLRPRRHRATVRRSPRRPGTMWIRPASCSIAAQSIPRPVSIALARTTFRHRWPNGAGTRLRSSPRSGEGPSRAKAMRAGRLSGKRFSSQIAAQTTIQNATIFARKGINLNEFAEGVTPGSRAAVSAEHRCQPPPGTDPAPPVLRCWRKSRAQSLPLTFRATTSEAMHRCLPRGSRRRP